MKVEWNQLHSQIAPTRPEGRDISDRVNGSPDATRDDRRQKSPQRRSILEDLVIQEKLDDRPEVHDAPPPSGDKGSGLNITV